MLENVIIRGQDDIIRIIRRVDPPYQYLIYEIYDGEPWTEAETYLLNETSMDKSFQYGLLCRVNLQYISETDRFNLLVIPDIICSKLDIPYPSFNRVPQFNSFVRQLGGMSIAETMEELPKFLQDTKQCIDEVAKYSTDTLKATYEISKSEQK